MDNAELNEIVRRAGGPNFDPYKKQREEAERFGKANDIGYSPFRIERASAKQPPGQTHRPLFGDLWRTGDIALLVGEPGVGKSLLATQIAEVIARGAKNSVNGLPATPKPQDVIYFDFERTQSQFAELYSHQPYEHTPYREHYKFSTRFNIARLDEIPAIPDAFNGNVDRYIRHWVFEEIVAAEARVAVIDNISHLAIGTTIEKVMRALRAASIESGSSILVVAHAKPKRKASAVTLADITRCRSLREVPNSIFAIARSTAHPDIRYVKDLKSHTAPLTADIAAAVMSAPGFTPSSAVLTYRLERLTSPILSSIEMGRDTNSQVSNPVQPFLGLSYLGLALESKHLPQIRIPRSQISNQRPDRLPSAIDALEQGIIDGSYAKYLLGE